MDSMKGKTLGEACGNPDGTVNGYKLTQWLYEAVSGKPMSEKDAEDLVNEAKRRVAERKAGK